MNYCFNPKYVDNRYRPGHVIQVPCGHCEGCLSHRADSWKQRIQVELSQHRYNFFVTLTYSNDFVPVFHPSTDNDSWKMTDLQRENLYSFLSKHDDSIADYYLVLKYDDIQRFIKRLRKYIYECTSIKSWQKCLRYFVCGEYGPTTKRPHYHAIFFLDSPELCEEVDGQSLFSDFVRKAWQVPSEIEPSQRIDIGSIKIERVTGSAAQYVAGYVTSFANLSPLLQQSPFKPFCQASRCPPIGSFRFDASQAKKVFIDGNSFIPNEYGDADKKNVDLFLFRSLADRLFPKCYGFSRLPFQDRLFSYGIARFPFRGCSFAEFIEYVISRKDSFFSRALAKIYFDIYDDSDDDINLFFDGLKLAGSPVNRRVLAAFRMSASVLTNCSIFDISLNEYVVKISDYYNKKDYQGLVAQLSQEQELSSVYDSRFLLGFVDKSLYVNDGRFVDADYRMIIESFGYSDFDDVINFDWFQLPHVKHHYDRIKSYVQRGKSFKAVKDYVLHGNLSNLNK